MKTYLFIALAITLQTVMTPFNASAGDRWEPAIQKFEARDQKTSPPKNAILFVGSSSIVGWHLNEYFPDLPTINRGFGGSQISDVIHYFDRIVTPYAPKTIVFYSGDNDIAAKETTTSVINDVNTFVSMVHQKLPSTHIILFPPKPSIARWHMYPDMKMVGDAEKALAERDDKVLFMDIEEQMIGPDGKPRKELFKSDGLHMNGAGYTIWSDMVRPFLEGKTSGTQTNTTADK